MRVFRCQRAYLLKLSLQVGTNSFIITNNFLFNQNNHIYSVKDATNTYDLQICSTATVEMGAQLYLSI